MVDEAVQSSWVRWASCKVLLAFLDGSGQITSGGN